MKGSPFAFLLAGCLLLSSCLSPGESPGAGQSEPLQFAPFEASFALEEGEKARLPGVVFVAGSDHPVWDSNQLALDGTSYPAEIYGEDAEVTPYGKVSSASITISNLEPGVYTEIGFQETGETSHSFELKVARTPPNTGELEVTGNFSSVAPRAEFFRTGLENTGTEQLSSFDFSLGLTGVQVDSASLCGLPLSQAVLEPGQVCQLEVNLSELSEASRIYVASPLLTYQGKGGQSVFTMPAVQYGSGRVYESQLEDWFAQ